MTTFYVISAAMMAVALLFLAPALLRPHRKVVEDTRDHNVRIARERLDELRNEHDKGELSDEEFAQAKNDLEIALAQDLTTADARVPQKDSSATARLTLVVLIVLLPVVTGAMYLVTGSPQFLHVAGPGQPMTQANGKMPSIGELTKELETRLNAEPNNPEGWFLLGRTYMKMGDYVGAVRAFERLSGLLPDNSAVKLSLADALSMQNQGRVPDRAVQLLEQVLKVEPKAVSALWLAGTAAADRGDAQKALDYWQRAYPLLTERPDMQRELRQLIGNLSEKSGIRVELAKAPVAAPSKGLHVTVALSPELVDKIPADTTVFVYAKAVSGPPMPLAVSRLTVGDLPATVTLNDSMAMMPQMKLSNFKQVLVGARVSESGQAMPQSGDLQSKEQETASDNKDTLQLLIDHRRP
jgi:cytochrome c-type biogenesis protein CcmH